jgi:hypothetical protein
VIVGPPWYVGGVADELAAALAAHEAALRLEQAPHGLDTWDERRLQHALAAALVPAFTVTLEAHYPSTDGRKRTHRPRCDLVVSRPGIPLHRGESLPLPLCPPEQALWLELKVARQRRPGGAPDARYAEQWRRHLIADLRKLSAEPRIHAAAIVLVAFVEDEPTLERDLDGFESIMARHDAIAGFRQVRTTPIVDRIGNRLAAVAVWPTVQAAGA